MSRNRWLPALLTATTFFAGCAGGSAPTALPLVQQGAPNSVSQHFRTTTPPSASMEKIREALGGPSAPTWQLLEPLDISNTATFSPAQNPNTCSPINALFGVWYVALGSFTLPLNGVTLPPCSTATPPPWQRLPGSPASATYNNLYIVELSIVGFSVNVTPIAGPVLNSGSTSYFQPLESSLGFSNYGLYSFYVASYTGPTLAQPDVQCIPGSTACGLGATPTSGNKLVVVVSDGSGQLPSLVVKDSAGNTLTQETISPNCGHCVAVYDEIAPAGITGAVSYTSGGTVYYPNESVIYELANVGAGRFASANTGGLPTSLGATISGVTDYDFQLCAYIQTGLSTGNVTLGFSNGSSSETYDFQSAGAVFAHAIAAATASSTCTANNITPAYEAGLAYADYP
jgi:hypothetical protein